MNASGTKHTQLTLTDATPTTANVFNQALGVALTLLIAFGLAMSAAQPATARAQVHSSAAFAQFVAELWPEAQSAGVSRKTFNEAFAGLKPDYSLPDLLFPGQKTPRKVGQAEFTRAPSDYLSTTYLRRLGKTGKGMAAKYATQLKAIEDKFGVDRFSILGIWGRETSFGRYTPKHDAIRVLATQAFTGRRAEMFRGELIDALRLLEKGVPRKKMRGSWAGAMGMTQFMPSEFFKHRHDFAGDGYADLFNSVPDALASAARQLKNKGWEPGYTWGYEIVIPGSSDCAEEGPPGTRTIKEWAALGYRRTGGRTFPEKVLDKPAYLMSPAGAYGPSFLALNNFKVFREYNTSDLYATFVGNLADRIAGGGDFRTPWQDIGPQRTAIIRGVQQGLKDRGYGISIVDGFIGSNTRRQVGLFQRTNGLKVDCWPTKRVLSALR
ncbi:MAG: lytic murein transglycosylase [Pseudomonadota bacterium]